MSPINLTRPDRHTGIHVTVNPSLSQQSVHIFTSFVIKLASAKAVGTPKQRQGGGDAMARKPILNEVTWSQLGTLEWSHLHPHLNKDDK